VLTKRQQRGFTWATAFAFSFTAIVSWWGALDKGEGGADLVAPIGFTIAAFIWLVNVFVAHFAAKATEGNDR
jgi:hypothetical protein